MPNNRKKYLGRLLRYSLFFLMLLLGLNVRAASAEEALILETYVQNYYNDDYAYAYKQGGKVYLSLPQMAGFVGLKYNIEDNKRLILTYSDKPKEKYIIDLTTKKIKSKNKEFSLSPQDYKIFDDTIFLSQSLWENFININIKIDYHDMSLSLDRAEDFPMVKKIKADVKRKEGVYDSRPTPISEYAFDNRMFGIPVVDLTLNKGYSKQNDYTSDTDSYSVNLAMLAGGLDVNAYFSGGLTSDEDQEIRINGSRTFLGEPRNMFNLRTLEIGDILGMGTSYFTNVSSGRGVTISSFKNLVMSADKTIDITGPLSSGWQVELYWNEQLVGYRQNGLNGQYNFPDMPVSYGLNTFKLVFYGPYGETKTEYKRYYSGTSPVKKGEFGYNFAAYQPYKNLIETNDKFFNEETKNIFDFVGYYGLSDNITLMGGYTKTPSADFLIDQNFSMVGLQYAIDGSSMQYNLEKNMDNNKVGHHFEWQGDVYIGQIYAGYDKYNDILSPLSSYGEDYIDEETEIRLSGSLPYNFPYYVSYRSGTIAGSKEEYKTITTRLSKYINGYNLSLENNFYKYLNDDNQNNVRLGVYKWWGDFSSETYLTMATKPEKELQEFTTRLDYRTGRNTYLTGEYTHEFENNMDYIRLSGGQVFDFGGLTATFETDKDFNFSTYLTYNISFTKAPDSMKLVSTGESKLSETGTIYAHLYDDKGNPLVGVGVNANGLEKQVYTDENGIALLTDLQTYEKTSLSVDMETLPDISLLPENFERRVVLHPGTVRHIEIPFRHHGAIEGSLENRYNQRMFGYQVSVKTKDNKEISTYSDVDGYFILDNVPYGTYNLQVTKDGKKIAEQKKVNVNDVVIYIDTPIHVKQKPIRRMSSRSSRNTKQKAVPVKKAKNQTPIVHSSSQQQKTKITYPQNNLKPLKKKEDSVFDGFKKYISRVKGYIVGEDDNALNMQPIQPEKLYKTKIYQSVFDYPQISLFKNEWIGPVFSKGLAPP